MEKSRDAFRTISEVADALGTQPHVLRFWESKFTQVKPVKRAGGRRYYRPGDVALLTGIKKLLHEDGVTIKGVQKVLRERGVKYVAGLADGGDVFPAVEDAVVVELPLAQAPEVEPALEAAPEAAPAEPPTSKDAKPSMVSALRIKAKASEDVDAAALEPLLDRLKALQTRLQASGGQP
ncbi:MAG: MerR family transcriptional regulator [Pseudomonadota bacterium]